MRKQELVHVHGLLVEVAEHCEATDGTAAELPTYRSLETRPTSIHRSKSDHKDAVFALLDDVTSALHDEQSEAVSTSAD